MMRQLDCIATHDLFMVMNGLDIFVPLFLLCRGIDAFLNRMIFYFPVSL